MSSLTREVHCIVGPPESGKSYQLRQMIGRAHRALTLGYDPADGYPGRTCRGFSELTDYLFDSMSLGRAVYYPEPDEFDACCELVQILQEEAGAGGEPPPFFLGVEEIALYPAAKDPFGKFAELCRQGRHQAVSIGCTTQAPGELPLHLRNVMTHYHFFQTVEINALEFVRQTLGKDAEETVRTLPAYTPLTYNRITREISPPRR